MSCPSPRRSATARVNEGSHSFTCHPHIYPPFAVTLQPHSVTVLWLVLISHPAEGRRLSWRGWLGEILRQFAHQKMVTHPSISRDSWELNTRPSSHESNALTTRLLSHPTAHTAAHVTSSSWTTGHVTQTSPPTSPSLCHRPDILSDFELRLYIPLDTKQVISDRRSSQPLSALVMKKLNLTQRKQTCNWNTKILQH